MRRTIAWPTALLLAACSAGHEPMTTPTDPAVTAAEVDAVADAPARVLPELDRDAAPIIANGRYETATFALG